jgi:hypothetical protein
MELVLVTFVYCDKTPEKMDSKEERFVLTHTFRGFSAFSLGSVVSGLWEGRSSLWVEQSGSLHGHQEAERRSGQGPSISQRHTHNDSFSSTSLHLQKAAQPPDSATACWLNFHHMRCGGHVRLKP